MPLVDRFFEQKSSKLSIQVEQATQLSKKMPNLFLNCAPHEEVHPKHFAKRIGIQALFVLFFPF